MEEVSDNHLPFLGCEGQRKGLFHKAWYDLCRSMRRPRTCMHPDCSDQSIPRSHAVQKSGPLSFISEISHVVTPDFASNTEGYSMKRVGINDASTFPGFCQKHEAIFNEFESKGNIESERSIALQVFRTICREIAVKQIQRDQIRKVRKVHDKLISESGIAKLKQRLGESFVKKHNIRNLTFKGVSKAQIGMKDAENELETVLKVLESEFLPASVMDLDGNSKSLSHVALTVGQTLPLCLTGIAGFGIDDHGKHLDVRVVLNVLPSELNTLIVATSLAEHQRYLHTYLNQMLELKYGPLVMIETWMVRGPDHWFMTPSEWESIPQNVQARVLADMLDESISIGEAYHTPIIQSVRRELDPLFDT